VKKVFGAMVTGAVSSVVVAGLAMGAEPAKAPKKADAGKVVCKEKNGCHGKGTCGGPDGVAKGKNTCAGHKKFVKDAKACTTIGGTVDAAAPAATPAAPDAAAPAAK